MLRIMYAEYADVYVFYVVIIYQSTKPVSIMEIPLWNNGENDRKENIHQLPSYRVIRLVLCIHTLSPSLAVTRL